MPIRIVQSKQNARLRELRKAIAHPGPNKRGLLAIEGPNLIEEAFRANLRVDCIFAGGENVAGAFDGFGKALEVLLIPGDHLKSILATESPQLVAALVEPPRWTWADLLETAAPALVVVLAGIQDPGNLGTIVRSAEAFGASGILCLPGTVNPWNPKAVRASAGSVFRVPLLNVRECEALETLRISGIGVLTTTVEGAQVADRADLARPVALVIGNEGNGVPAELVAKADGAVTIPCPGPVESLNAAVATRVLLYEAARQRAASKQSPAIGLKAKMRGGSR